MMSFILDAVIHCVIMPNLLLLILSFLVVVMYLEMYSDFLGFLRIKFILCLLLAGSILFTAKLFLIYSCLSSTATAGPDLSGTILFVIFTAQVHGICTI